MQTSLDFDNSESVPQAEEQPTMSTNRVNPERGTAHVSALPKGENGRALCRKCNKEVPPGRVTFCGEKCIHEHKLRSDVSYLRSQVFLRDRGVCKECGQDTEVWRRSAMKLRPRPRILYLQSLGIPPHRTTFWDADHILPVALGGGECGLEGFQTLCYGCHARKTAAMAKTIRDARSADAKATKPKRGPSAAQREAQRAFDERQRRLGHRAGDDNAPGGSPC